MRIITRTIYGSALQTALTLNLPYEAEENTTLNERFNILPSIGFNNVRPAVKYLCIGNKGHKVITGVDGIPFTTPVNHRATDAGLFNPIPFVLRPIEDDHNSIYASSRAKYALRKIETHGDRQYAAYYLKRMNLDSNVVSMQKTTVVDGVSTTVDFIANTENLNPNQPELPPNQVITTNGVYLSASSIIPIIFTELDVAELINVAEILYGNTSLAIISEFGLCSGSDYSTTLDLTNINFTEAVGVQIATHITGYYPVAFTNKGFELLIEAGATEPLLGNGA